MTLPLLEIADLHKHFAVGGGLLGRGTQTVRALDGVSFDVDAEVFQPLGATGHGRYVFSPRDVARSRRNSHTVPLANKRQMWAIRSAALFERPHERREPVGEESRVSGGPRDRRFRAHR